MKNKDRTLDTLGFFKIIFSIFLLLLLFMMIGKIFLGEFSISKLSEVKEEQLIIEQDISLLRKNNEEMINEINILNSDEGLEGLARSELGLIKEGETFYQFEVNNPSEN
ncbi:MAG: hypothetical protein Ct9H90mP4_14430 [Gammaproteobacteria bacterium]|nr:MAG: hypothetical protein Ct9H90mP4_14430 [Gammaproteobacteria bacterium]